VPRVSTFVSFTPGVGITVSSRQTCTDGVSSEMDIDGDSNPTSAVKAEERKTHET